MKRILVGLVLLSFLGIGFPASGETASNSLLHKRFRIIPPIDAMPRDDDPAEAATDLTGPTIDIREVLDQISVAMDVSLILSREARGIIHLKWNHPYTIEQALNQSASELGLGWRMVDGCLYVARERQLKAFLDSLADPEVLTAKHTLGKKMNADFRSIDTVNLFRIMRHMSGVDIRASEALAGDMTLRVSEMPWERVFLSIVHLNGFRLVESEFSITVVPAL